MKRIVICADGTWNSPLQDHPTNVLTLARAVSPVAADGTRQVCFYDWGVGSDGQKLSGGIAGAGIDKNIKDAYRFLVHNYAPGDELFFFGFSRGAYTVRSLAGFIRNCGLLRREHADQIEPGYELYRKRAPSSAPSAARARAFRRSYAVADVTRIRFVGVFDTVGTLGVPITFWGLLDNDEYLFHDTSPSRIIDCARHAVALDEDREDFLPTLWDAKPGIDLQQVWFSGVHCDVGGSYKEDGLSDTAFAWVVKEAQGAGLEFERHLSRSIRPNPLDKQHNERRGVYRLRGKVVRELPEGALIHRSVKRRLTSSAVDKRSAALERYLAAYHGGSWTGVPLVD